MQVLDFITMSPPGIWTGGGTSGTAFFNNPWSNEDNPACDVWIQLTAGSAYAYEGDWYFGFGICEVEYIGSNGLPQTQVFADTSDLSTVIFPNVPVLQGVTQMLSFTVGWYAPNYYGCIYPTLFQWGTP